MAKFVQFGVIVIMVLILSIVGSPVSQAFDNEILFNSEESKVEGNKLHKKEKWFDFSKVRSSIKIPIDKIFINKKNKDPQQVTEEDCLEESYYHFENISKSVCRGNIFRRNTAKGPSKVKQTFSIRLSASMSKEITDKTTLDLADVAKALDFRFMRHELVSLDYTVTIPEGKMYDIFACSENDLYSFDLCEGGEECSPDDKKIGHFWFKQPTGIYAFWQKAKRR